MDKKELIDKFGSGEGIKRRNKKAEKLSLGSVKFDSKKNISFKNGDEDCTIDFCETCFHPGGVTMNFFEMCPSFEGVDIKKLATEFKRHSKSYFELAKVKGRCMCHIVIPPDPKMILELGEHIDALLQLEDFAVTIYDPEKDKRGTCVISEEFFKSLEEDPAFEGKDYAEIFTTFLMEFAETL